MLFASVGALFWEQTLIPALKLGLRPRMRPFGLLAAVYFGTVATFVLLMKMIVLRFTPPILPPMQMQPGLTVMTMAVFEAAQALCLAVVILLSEAARPLDPLLKLRARPLLLGALAGLLFQCLDLDGLRGLLSLGATVRLLPVTDGQRAGGFVLGLIYAGVYAFLGPFLEEVFFRGLLQSSFEKHFGTLGSIVLTAAAFSLVHWELHNPYLDAYAFFLGVLFSSARFKEGSLSFPLGCHVAFNLMAALETIADVHIWPLDMRLLVSGLLH